MVNWVCIERDLIMSKRHWKDFKFKHNNHYMLYSACPDLTIINGGLIPQRTPHDLSFMWYEVYIVVSRCLMNMYVIWRRYCMHTGRKTRELIQNTLIFYDLSTHKYSFQVQSPLLNRSTAWMHPDLLQILTLKWQNKTRFTTPNFNHIRRRNSGKIWKLWWAKFDHWSYHIGEKTPPVLKNNQSFLWW